MKKLKILLVAVPVAVALLLLLSCDDEYSVVPKLNTLDAADADIGARSANLKGEFVWVGNQKIVEYGIEISKNAIFNPSQRFTNPADPAAGTYAVEVTGLEPNTLYYFKAFATINTAQVYSQMVKSFTTKEEAK